MQKNVPQQTKPNLLIFKPLQRLQGKHAEFGGMVKPTSSLKRRSEITKAGLGLKETTTRNAPS
jgi:hypothetical protein